MDDSAVTLLLAGLAINTLLGFLVATLAKNKGYKFWNWFFACSILGLIWVIASRNTVTEEMSEEFRKDTVRKGNTTGIVLSIVQVFFTLFTIF